MTGSPLDDAATYDRQDPAGLYARIVALPGQIREAWDAATALNVPDDYARAVRIAVLGMGGSGIGGSLLRALAVELGATTPVEVVRGYRLPAHVDARTLAVASSASGNTEEILTLAQQALDRGARAIAITTGGRLLDLARKNGIPALAYAWQGEPRAALGWSFATLLAIAGRLRLLPDLGPALPAALDHMRSLVDACGRAVPESANPAKQLARRLHGRLPVIAGADALAPVAYRWVTQTNENAKSWGLALELPEMNHNAPVGYGAPPALVPLLHVVLLRQRSVHPRIARRIDLSRQQLAEARVAVEIVDVPGGSALEEILWAVQLGDFASYYLGILNGADPSEVRALDWLKEQMLRG
jgi:glucose/mannose-6-phosphate isomerase